MTRSDVPDLQRWHQVRSTTRRTAERFGALVRSAGRGQAMATRDWTVADAAAHVLSLAAHYAVLFDPAAPRLPVPDLDRILAATHVDNVREANAVVLGHLPERDPERLADSLLDSVERLLGATEDADPREPVRWLGDSLVPTAGVLAHLVNELLVHGWDIARALGRPWPMADADAALFTDEFLVGMIRRDYGLLLETGVRVPRRTIGVEFRSAYTAPARLILQDGRVHVGADDEPVDARVTFRPARFNLMLFGRISVARALVRRDVVIAGPRPWLLPTFLRVVHMPHN
jgi:uncharacterized protein (TIGR03083 family)